LAQAFGFGFSKSQAKPKAKSGQHFGLAWLGLAWLWLSGQSQQITKPTAVVLKSAWPYNTRSEDVLYVMMLCCGMIADITISP